MSETAFWVGDKQYVAETATPKEKAKLKDSHPELHERYFPEVKKTQKHEVESVSSDSQKEELS